MRLRSRAPEAYVALLALAAALVLWQAASRGADWRTVGLLAALHLLAEWQFSNLWPTRVVLTLGSIVIMAALIIVGPLPSTLVALTSIVPPVHIPLVKRIFNASQAVLCTVAAGTAYVLLGGPVGPGFGPDAFPRVLLPVLAMQAVYVVCNALLLSVVVRLSSGVPMWGLLRGVLLPSAAGYVAYGLFGLLLAALWLGGLGGFSAVLLLLPLFIARWVFAQYAAEKEAYEATVRALVQAVETKDVYTRGHSERVAQGSVMTARGIGMRQDRIESLRYAALLHDLGKISVPTRILQKTSRLDDGEFAAVQLHPVRGVEMVRDIDFLDEARRGILHHHERVDGLGYPMGLRGNDIPEFARVIAVADAFDAMTTVRSYRGARSVDEARRELERGRGTQFDPAFVESFLVGLDRDGWEVPEPLAPAPRRPRRGGLDLSSADAATAEDGGRRGDPSSTYQPGLPGAPGEAQ